MFRFYFLIATHIHFALFCFFLMRKAVKNMKTISKQERWNMCRRCISIIVKHSKCPVVIHGVENLPKEAGYILMPNHQGRWDGIVMTYGHERSMSFVIDQTRSNMPVEKDFMDASESLRIDRTNGREAYKTLKLMTERVSKGDVFCLFPEGGYDNNGNAMREFSSSCFHFLKNKPCVIVPVCIKDSYRVFNYTSWKEFFRHITVDVYFLEPINIEEYASMSKSEISDLVKSRIQQKLDEVV